MRMGNKTLYGVQQQVSWLPPVASHPGRALQLWGHGMQTLNGNWVENNKLCHFPTLICNFSLFCSSPPYSSLPTSFPPNLLQSGVFTYTDPLPHPYSPHRFLLVFYEKIGRIWHDSLLMISVDIFIFLLVFWTLDQLHPFTTDKASKISAECLLLSSEQEEKQDQEVHLYALSASCAPLCRQKSQRGSLDVCYLYTLKSWSSNWKIQVQGRALKVLGNYSWRYLHALGLIYLIWTILTENNTDRVRKESGQKMLIYIFSFRAKHGCTLPGKC